MKVTCTNGNAQNKINGSRITVYCENGEIVDRFEVPSRNGVAYCKSWPNGKYGKRYAKAIEDAKLLDTEN